MPSPEKHTNTIAENIEEERLRLWREKRAKVAEASRQERIKIAEAERRSRLEAFELDKAKRVKEAAEQRAQKEAAKVAERMAVARSRIAGRTDIEVARQRLLAFRKRAARMLALRLTLFVVIPTCAVAAYLLILATPFYTSKVQFALQSPDAPLVNENRTPFASSNISRESYLLRQVLVSPEMLAALDEKTGFTEHLSGEAIDPLQRVGGPAQVLLGENKIEQNVDVFVNGQDGIITIQTKATDPERARDFSTTMLAFARAWLNEPGSDKDAVRVITRPTLASQPNHHGQISTLLLAFLGFSSLYAFVAIFGRTLLRHSER